MPILQWLNREETIKVKNKVPFRLLEEDKTLSYGDKSDNMIIQGDNLEALKAILPYYAGQVKCIYIDPPYNTKSAFEHYDDNLEHSQWLHMIYPRLELLHELLQDDGSLWISIDDNELAYLITITDEIFGRNNRICVCTFKQSSASGPKSINPGVVSTCSYVLGYAKNKKNWFNQKVFVPRPRDERYAKYIANYEEVYTEWTLISIKAAFSNYMQIPEKDIENILGRRYEAKLTKFVLDKCDRVVRTARVAPKDVGQEAKEALKLSEINQGLVYKVERESKDPQFFLKGEQLVFYSSKVREIDGVKTTVEPLTNVWTDLLSNNLHKEGAVSFPDGKKPEYLIKRIFEMTTGEADLVIDSFLGSGTTAAVAHKMGRRYIGIEMGDHAITHVVPRMKKVVDGEQGGISKAVNWQGGSGFRFYRLGEPVFDEYGQLSPNVEFPTLAAHIWFTEIKSPHIGQADSPLIGVHEGTAYYLLYNGILGDKRPDGGNVLTNKVIEVIPAHDGPKVIYGEASRLGDARLKQLNITFKQTPYDIKIR